MTEAQVVNQPQEENFISKLMQETVQTMTHADEQEATERVKKLRDKRPTATNDELAEVIIRNKCMQAGAIGAVTASPTLIPGLGTVVALTFGTAVDIRMMYKLQGELVLELINLYAPSLPLENKRNVLMLVTGISIGANRVLSEGGQELAAKATQRLSARLGGTVAEEVAVDASTGLFAKTVSLALGVATAAGINILTTYTIGRRAQAYLKQGHEAMEDWTTSLRTITGVDERKLITWLAATTRHSWDLIQAQSKDIGTKLANVGQNAKELYVIQAAKAGDKVSETSGRLVEGSSYGLSWLRDFSKNAAHGVAAGTSAWTESMVDKVDKLWSNDNESDDESDDESAEIDVIAFPVDESIAIPAPDEVPVIMATPPQPLPMPQRENEAPTSS